MAYFFIINLDYMAYGFKCRHEFYGSITMTKISVTLTQHPVGQGGLMSGLLEIVDGKFHWIYDCGSNQTEALDREIDLVSVQGIVDCLFLSHLDSDHVNGVDRLLARTHVREVVMPYLNDLDRLVAAAHDDARGMLTGSFLIFLDDIEGWFRSRGVTKITFIVPYNDDGDEIDEGPKLPPHDKDETASGNITAEWDSSSKKSIMSSKDNESLIVQQLGMRATMMLKSSTGSIDWYLLPYAFRPSDNKFFLFRKALSSEFGRVSKSLLKKILRDPDARKKVRKCYDLIWSDHNLVSMALYVGPRDSNPWDAELLHALGWWRHRSHNHPAGWLGTGDMHLNIERRRKAFISYFHDIFAQVNVFCLPHHGSYRNFHASLIEAMPTMTQCVASAGPNGYGHPSKSVKQIVKSNGREFIRVNNKGKSFLKWRHKQ